MLCNSIASREDIFRVADSSPDEKFIIVIDEFQNIGKANPAFPSIIQKIWDGLLIYALIGKCTQPSICQASAEKIYILFAKTGFTKKLMTLANERTDVLLIALEDMDFERAV